MHTDLNTQINTDKVIVKDLNLWYGDFQALKDISFNVKKNQITAVIGPSGCGKSTLLRVFNRMNDLIEDVRVEGNVLIDGDDILTPKIDLVQLRKKIGMVFQRPNPFPLSIFENIVFSLRIHPVRNRLPKATVKIENKNGISNGVNNRTNKKELPLIVERCLREVLLWDDLKDKLNTSALSLSLEQQQRLCIARLLPVKPDILLMDEPCSALDPQATQRIEELMFSLKDHYTIIIVTHNMQQAARVSEETGFMLLGELVEFDKTKDIFAKPEDKRTEDYIAGRFG